MLARLLTRPLHLRCIVLNLASSSSHQALIPTSQLPPPPPPLLPNSRFLDHYSRHFSTRKGHGTGDDGGTWKFSPDADDPGSVFGEEDGTLSGITEGRGDGDVFGSKPARASARPEVIGGDLWSQTEQKGDIFEAIERDYTSKKEEGGVIDEWETAEGYKPWSLGGGEDEKQDVFDIAGGEGIEGIGDGGIDDVAEKEGDVEKQQMEMREQELLSTLKGPERAFGDLIGKSGITEDMICSLILLKDVINVPGLPPLSVIEDKAIARLNETSTRGEIERKKQEEITQARVRQVDEKGRAYGTGRRKCSIARVWIQRGDGKFTVNDKPFDSYFPILDHRAQLLHPFILTNSLGLWDITCTVKGGGVSGQVGAIRLGISRALQNSEPGLRQYLKPAGYLTRDPRVVERKKPGRAKARKSFQWVKR